LGTILGLIVSFSFFTLTLTWIVHATGISPSAFRYVAIGLIALFGLILIFPKLSYYFAKISSPIASLGQKIQDTKPRQGFWGGVIFGVALGLLWTPCAGPILASITTLVATSGVNLSAILMTLSYSVGAGLPLLLLAYGSSKLVTSFRFLARYTERIRQFFGVLMLAFALVLSLHWDMLINEKLSRAFPELISEKSLHTEKKLQEINRKEKLPEKERAPELTGITQWINSPPLKLSELKGKVVLIDFWTYSCINCIRTLPYLKNWYRDYKDYGFVIIGVHTPEFEFEKSYDNVKKAVDQFGISYPVALDNNYATWKAYHNSYWPAHYLIDQNGMIRMTHFGEGKYSETENAIRELLGMVPLESKEERRVSRAITPETYLGYARADAYQMSIKRHTTTNYNYSGILKTDQVGLKGPWVAYEEYIQAEGDACYLDLAFQAKEVYLVLGGSSSTPLEITLDGKPYGKIQVDGDKKYDIVTTSYGIHQLSLKVPKGIKAYVFTFGENSGG
jgi:cytochrome c biogenesis protein CcdA/thiol-disulfide isomerase/thioredoxin